MKVFDYEDIQLIPNKCIVNSRSECDTTVTLGKHSFKMPVVPANMQVIAGTMNLSRIEEIAKASEIMLTREDWYDLYMAAGNILP